MDTQRLIESLHPLERKVVPALSKFSILSDIAQETKLKEVEVMRALQWLQNKKIIDLRSEEKELISLDKNGDKYLKQGLPEKRFLKALTKPLSLGDIQKKADLEKEELNVCLGALKSKAAINIKKEKDKTNVSITSQGKKLLEKESLEEQFLKKKFPIESSKLKDEEKFAFQNLKKRKNIVKIEVKKIKSAALTQKGKDILKKGIKEGKTIDTLTPEMIKAGSWKNKTFRRYDIKINVPKINGGKRHFVNQAIEYAKQIWLEMGFTEMTGPIVHTSFWDLDALFVPQDHPARSMQDTFYVDDPFYGKLPKWYKKIKDVHENGGDTGSKGWQSPWDAEVAKENLLRTHTTVLSAQTIEKMKESDLPAKFFAVNRVYRNEALDWKHLFELHQVEGIVVDPNANFRNLKAYLKEFFAKMGFPDVRIRPAHFPYTEPSAEIDVLHPEKNEWVELGGSGIFRPEVTKSLIGIEVPVLAWGFGLERTISSYYNISDIRDLYKNDLKQIRRMKTWIK